MKIIYNIVALQMLQVPYALGAYRNAPSDLNFAYIPFSHMFNDVTIKQWRHVKAKNNEKQIHFFPKCHV